MALTYSSYVTTLANLTGYDASDTNFLQILPSAIAYAENRINREMNLLSTLVRDSSGNFTANSRTLALPTPGAGAFSIVDGVNVLTPAGTTTSDGTRVPLTPATRDVIDMLWPSETSPSATTYPTYFTVLSSSSAGVLTLLVGPAPGASFNVEVVGFVNPTPLSESNTTTYLTAVLPDLFIAASMIFMTGYMKNFGAQADTSQQAVSWESQYRTLFESANMVDAQQKFASASWTSKTPEPLAPPPAVAQRG